MTAVQRHQLKIFLKAILYGAIAPFSFGVVFTVAAGRLSLFTFVELLLAALACGILASIAICGAEAALLPRLRDRPVILSVLLRPFAYFIGLAGSIALSIWFNTSISSGQHLFDPQVLRNTSASLGNPFVRASTFTALGLALIMSFFINIGRKLGPGVMRNWMLGRYHRPRIEDRVFMFLDMKDSTPLAESLGDLAYSALVRDFFVDITPALLETKGEVSHYIGDEAVISWRVDVGLRDANCVRCFGLVKAEVERRRSEYLKRFGLVPEFKAGIHSGRVVATEVGTLKSEIVFHGDVLNTTSRIVGMCSEVGHDFLASAELASKLAPVPGISLHHLGSFELKGKAEDVALVAVLVEGELPRKRTARKGIAKATSSRRPASEASDTIIP